MKKNVWTKIMIVSTLVASAFVGGVVPNLSPTNVAYAASPAQVELDAFAKHYATFYKTYETKFDHILGLLNNPKDNKEKILLSYEELLTETETFLTTNLSYGSAFNADAQAIDVIFHNWVALNYKSNVALVRYYAGDLNNEEYLSVTLPLFGEFEELHKAQETLLQMYKTKYNVTFNRDVWYLLHEEAPPTASTTYTVKHSK